MFIALFVSIVWCVIGMITGDDYFYTISNIFIAAGLVINELKEKE